MSTMLVVLAIYVSGGRLLMGALSGFQDEIEHALSQRDSGRSLGRWDSGRHGRFLTNGELFSIFDSR